MTVRAEGRKDMGRRFKISSNIKWSSKARSKIDEGDPVPMKDGSTPALIAAMKPCQDDISIIKCRGLANGTPNIDKALAAKGSPCITAKSRSEAASADCSVDMSSTCLCWNLRLRRNAAASVDLSPIATAVRSDAWWKRNVGRDELPTSAWKKSCMSRPWNKTPRCTSSTPISLQPQHTARSVSDNCLEPSSCLCKSACCRPAKIAMLMLSS
mmetsp:Transcript_129308/g.275820  ORF Transcript_129308/g.275820 Transcript_129308/m.275820 type:complete len:212 (+) Transcript_129308:862-1497(+)